MNGRTESENEHGLLRRLQGEDPQEERATSPLQQIAAAFLCYTGVISTPEARELAGFSPGADNKHARNMRILARFIKSTGRSVPPSLANWWPGAGQ